MPTYSVSFPDGHVQEFSAPGEMSDTQAFARALQERGIAEGKIQTTWFGGAAKAVGEDPTTTGALMAGAGMLTGTAPAVALAPLAARWLQYATQKFTGQSPATPSVGEQAVLAGAGAVGAYGPELVASGLAGAAARTVAHQLPNGTWTIGLKGHGILPWAVREGTQAASGVAEQVLRPLTPEAVGTTVSEILGRTDPLNAQEIAELGRKLLDPKIANNPTAQAAIRQAIKSRSTDDRRYFNMLKNLGGRGHP